MRLAHYQDHGIPNGDQVGRRGNAQASLVQRRDFYVRVGYTPWRTYLMSRRRLTST